MAPVLDPSLVEALFVSPVQFDQDPTDEEIRTAIFKTVTQYGTGGCAERVAQEFGDHPETAVVRMTRVRETLRVVYA